MRPFTVLIDIVPDTAASSPDAVRTVLRAWAHRPLWQWGEWPKFTLSLPTIAISTAPGASSFLDWAKRGSPCPRL
jgi:hypothetical protein